MLPVAVQAPVSESYSCAVATGLLLLSRPPATRIRPSRNRIAGALSRATDMPYGAIVKTGARISVLNGYQFGDATFSVQGTLDKTVGNNPITMSVTGRGGTAVADIVPFSGYWTHYDTVGAPSNSFGKMEVVRIPNGLCTMRGLFKQLVAWNGASSPTFTNMFQLPVGFRPGTWLMGWVHMQDTAAQRYDGPCNMDPAGMLSLRYPEMIGTSNGNQSFGMFLFNAWQALA